MAGRVPVGRQQDDRAVAEDVVLAVEHPVIERMVEIDRARAVARDEARPARRFQLRTLHEERRPREELVAAAVIEVQMRVGHVAHVVGLEAESRQLRHHVVPGPRLDGEALDPLRAEPGERVEPRLAVHAGVEQKPTAWMIHEEARDRHGPRLAGLEVGHHAGAIELDVAGAEGVNAHRGHLACRHDTRCRWCYDPRHDDPRRRSAAGRRGHGRSSPPGGRRASAGGGASGLRRPRRAARRPDRPAGDRRHGLRSPASTPSVTRSAATPTRAAANSRRCRARRRR